MSVDDKKPFIYADNAATTNMSEQVVQEMLPYLTDHFGNPSSAYSIAHTTKKAIERAREQVAAAIGASPKEIYFTGCGTEADNWAIKGGIQALMKRGKTHIITTNFEHHAVLHPCEFMAKMGFEVTFLPVDEDGYVTAQQVKQAIQENTGLVSVMYANNEIGTIQPIAEIGQLCRNNKIWFHTDAVQAVGWVALDVVKQSIDMLSLSGHKFHGPKGIGALYIRQGIVPASLMHGGAQERNRRPGTENVASIVGLGKAIELAVQNIPQRVKQVSAMRDYLIEGLLKIEGTRLNGGRAPRLAGNVNISFEAVEGEGLLLLLDMNGICASSGSACTSGSLDPSHVLLALGLPHEIAHGSVRLSINEDTKQSDLDHIITTLPKLVERLRVLSPVWDKK